MNHALNNSDASAAAAFTKQSAVFDALYSNNPIIQYKRARVRAHVMQYLQPGSDILELNSGTGEDAWWFAANGHHVHATDISAGMLEQLRKKTTAAGLESRITAEQISFTNLTQLQQHKQYDLIFSNFAGLNCTGALDKVMDSFSALLKPGGFVTLVLLPRFCLWEFLLLFKGKFKTAFRRLFSGKGASAHIEGEYFTCWYYNPSFVAEHMGEEYDLLSAEGLCTIVPPSYMEDFATKHPRLYAFLCRKEAALKSRWPWRSVGDYYIISLRKKNC
ncbi:MAG: class I SAM-dependent methyltransferase [Ferruginibacter sp.]